MKLDKISKLIAITTVILSGLTTIAKAEGIGIKNKSEIIQFMNSSEADSISREAREKMLTLFEKGSYDTLSTYIKQAEKEERIFRLVRSELNTLKNYIKEGKEGSAIDLIIIIKGQLDITDLGTKINIRPNYSILILTNTKKIEDLKHELDSLRLELYKKK